MALRSLGPAHTLEVSPDTLTVWLNVMVSEHGLASVTREEVFERLASQKIVQGIDVESIDAAIAKVSASHEPLARVVVARGIAPVRGRDAKLSFLVPIEKVAGEVLHDGYVDFHERNTIIPASAGEPVCEVVPATAGVAGVDVHGKILPAQKGADSALRAGANVTVSSDGALFTPTADGVLVVAGGVVTVSEVAVVKGDVNFAVGNVYSKNAVHIKGSVLSGFTVHADTHVTVDGMVEDATIEAGGNVTIRGGVVQHGKGLIRAGGGVRIGYAQNATIQASGDIIVQPGGAMGCTLQSGGRIVAIGKTGKIVGGVAHASQGIEARQLGSAASIETRVGVHLKMPDLDVIDSDDRILRSELADLEAKVGASVTLEDIEDVFADDLRSFAREVVIRRDEIRELRAALAIDRLDIVQRALAEHAGEVVVLGSAFPGVTVSIGGAHRHIEAEAPQAAFYRDPHLPVVMSRKA